jgi:hypothetical protein
MQEAGKSSAAANSSLDLMVEQMKQIDTSSKKIARIIKVD